MLYIFLPSITFIEATGLLFLFPLGRQIPQGRSSAMFPKAFGCPLMEYLHFDRWLPKVYVLGCVIFLHASDHVLKNPRGYGKKALLDLLSQNNLKDRLRGYLQIPKLLNPRWYAEQNQYRPPLRLQIWQFPFQHLH